MCLLTQIPVCYLRGKRVKNGLSDLTVGDKKGPEFPKRVD